MDGPFLKVALICERVLIEKDGSLSPIRIYDRTSIELSPPLGEENQPMPPVRLEPWVFISFIRGSGAAAHRARLSLHTPSGKEQGKAQEYPFTFPGDAEEATANLVFQTQFDADEVGVYWMHVSLDDVLMTRLPLRIEKTITPRK